MKRLTWTTRTFVILISMILLLGACSLRGEVQNLAIKMIERSGSLESRVITEEDLKDMPAPLVKYLRFSKVVGKVIPKFVRIKYGGFFKMNPSNDWTPFECEQYTSLVTSERLWYGSFPTMPVDGYDILTNGKGKFYVKMMGLFTVAEATGYETDYSETVVYFNDMMLYPSALVDQNILWKVIDDNRIRGTLTVNGISVTADMYFTHEGELTNWVTEERYAAMPEGLRKSRWSTPITKSGELFGFVIPSEGGAVWNFPEGDYMYIKLTGITAMDINKGELFE